MDMDKEIKAQETFDAMRVFGFCAFLIAFGVFVGWILTTSLDMGAEVSKKTIAALPQQTVTIEVDSEYEYKYAKALLELENVTGVDVAREGDVSKIAVRIAGGSDTDPTDRLEPTLTSAVATLDDFLAEVDKSDKSPEIVEARELRDKIEALRKDIAMSELLD